jgi:molecular chaperone HscB
MSDIKITHIANMDRFERLGIEKSYTVDLDNLEQKYFAAQSKYHPDKFSNSSEQEKLLTAQHATMVNEAYVTLKSCLKRAIYLLELAGINSLEDIKASDELLEQIWDYNRQFERIGEKAKIAAITAEVEEAKEKCKADLNKAFTENDIDKAAQLTMKLRFLKRVNDKEWL